MNQSQNLIWYLKFWAEFAPKSISVRSMSTRLSSRQLFNLVRKVAGKLVNQGVRPGNVVYLNLPQLQEIVVFLALNMIGAKCAHHFSGYKQDFPVVADVWIRSNEKENVSGVKTLLLNNDWWLDIEQTKELDVNSAYSWSLDEICYFVYTSGTTGSFKCLGLSYSHLLHYDAKTTSPWNTAELTFSLFGWSGAFAQFLTTLIIKGRQILVSNRPEEVQELFSNAKPSILIGSPALIAAFIENALVKGTDLRSAKEIVNMGGQLSPTLFQKIRENVPEANLTNLYGSTEGGRIASMKITRQTDGNIAGAILPEAQVQIVDKSGQQLPRGSSGLVRYRALVSGYQNDPEATAQVFRDGWFYCGDLGHFDKNNLLVLEGRESEVLNVGGEKIDPLTIDQFVITQKGVIDCGTFAIQTQSGRHATGIAVVAGQQFDSKLLRAAVLAKFPNAAPLAIVSAESIPKTQMGKIMRKLLSSQFQESNTNKELN